MFSDFFLRIEPGKTTALVGHSGSGKSTLVKLLLRLYDVEKGDITIDGQNIQHLKMDSWYKYVGYMSQESAIFDGTVRENLSYALDNNTDIRSQTTEEAMWEAMKKAEIADLVASFDQ